MLILIFILLNQIILIYIANLLGKVVYSQTVNSTIGINEIKINNILLMEYITIQYLTRKKH